MHCPEPVVWRGSWRAPKGRRYRIEACDGHRPAPDEGRALTAAGLGRRRVAWGYVGNSEGRSISMAGIARMRTIVLDCPDPLALARFYGELLGWEVTYADDDWVNLAGPGGKLSFQLAPDYVAPTWPDPKVPQQFHVDVTVDDVDAAEQAVLALGATKTAEQPGVPDGNWRVYLDPAGHPFCLCWD
jgi:predicted enzyme related to lactoylglutathione lyase